MSTPAPPDTPPAPVTPPPSRPRASTPLLVLATTSLPRRFTDALTPWDLSDLVPYRPEYLAGLSAEGYTVPLAQGRAIAHQEMEAVIARDVRRDIGGDVQQISDMQTRHSAEVRQIASAHVETLERKIREMQEMVDTLRDLIGACMATSGPTARF